MAGVTEELREAVCAAVAEALGDAYDCTRVWSAWSHGTMGPDDFSQVAEDDSRVAEIADAAINAMATSHAAVTELNRQIELLRAQRDAWKEVAEHQYGLLRDELYGDADYPVAGALDAWAAGRHPVLASNYGGNGHLREAD